MAGDRYSIEDQQETYFITCTVVRWVDLFTRPVYKDIIADAFNHCIKHKGLVLNSWVLMTNHLHFIGRCEAPHRMSDFLRDFKKFTSKRLSEAIINEPESRRDWLLDRFGFEARKSKRHTYYKIWTEDNHPVALDNINALKVLNYIHNNPVKAGIVYYAEDYLYSSAGDYAGRKGFIPVELI